MFGKHTRPLFPGPVATAKATCKMAPNIFREAPKRPADYLTDIGARPDLSTPGRRAELCCGATPMCAVGVSIFHMEASPFLTWIYWSVFHMDASVVCVCT